MDELLIKIVLSTAVLGYVVFAFFANAANPFVLPFRSVARLRHRSARWAGIIVACSPVVLLLQSPTSIPGGIRFSVLCALPVLFVVALTYATRLWVLKRRYPVSDSGPINELVAGPDAELTSSAKVSDEKPEAVVDPQGLTDNPGGLPNREPLTGQAHDASPAASLFTDRLPVGINADRKSLANRVVRRTAIGRNRNTAELSIS